MAKDTRAAGRTGGRRRTAVLGAALGGCVLVAAGTVPSAAQPGGPGRTTAYVALGDSYTSGPGIPRQVDTACGRSDRNYPSLVAARPRVTAFTDVSCGGATTAEMWRAQGTNPPQLDALDRHTDLVTLQIGGNDVGFGTVIGTCARLAAQDPAGNPCERSYRASGLDELAVAVVRTAPKVDRVLRAVHARAPHARVVVVGYPDLLPDDGSGCFPQVPFARGDFPYLRDTEKRLNLMLRLVAAVNHAAYVDTYGPRWATTCARRPRTAGSSRCSRPPPPLPRTPTPGAKPPWRRPCWTAWTGGRGRN